ncbi:hypothetical protein OQA88_10964 [Cercophora sp. LCS_1]
MVKLSTVAFTVACTLPSLAAAAKCTNGLFYCGYNLKRKGDYVAEMAAENNRVGAKSDSISLWYTLYYCGAGGDGWIKFWEKCEKCYDGGPGQSDSCGH